MADKMYVVEVSKNGRKTKETVAAANGARARRKVESNNPNAMIWSVDTL